MYKTVLGMIVGLADLTGLLLSSLGASGFLSGATTGGLVWQCTPEEEGATLTSRGAYTDKPAATTFSHCSHLHALLHT